MSAHVKESVAMIWVHLIIFSSFLLIALLLFGTQVYMTVKMYQTISHTYTARDIEILYVISETWAAVGIIEQFFMSYLIVVLSKPIPQRTSDEIQLWEKIKATSTSSQSSLSS